MPRKPNPPPDDPEQSKRFIEGAKEVEVDETREGFDRAFKKIILRRHVRSGAPKRHRTDHSDDHS